jgi:hypothetical protein
MIKIRYRDPNELSPGLHAAAECHGRGTTVYLLCGLTAAQRRSALRRIRLSARMGHCPRLPVVQLGLALCADRIGTGVGRAGAVFRSHPAGSTVPVMMVSVGVIAFLMLSTVSIRVRVMDEPPPSLPAPSVSGIAGPGAGSPSSPVAGVMGQTGSFDRDAGQLISAQTGSGGSSVFTGPAISGFWTGAGSMTVTSTTDRGDLGPTSVPASGATSPAPLPSASAPGTTPPAATAPAPAAAATQSLSPAATASSAETPTPAATSAQPIEAAGAGGGLCLDVGQLRVCLDG